MARIVHCIKLGTEAEGLDRPPYPGELGKRIYEGVSKQAWADWLKHQTMLVNENRLNLADARARGATQFALLGDLVGYGGEPVAVVEQVRGLAQQGALCVLGNHDAEQDIPRAGIGRIVTSYAGTLNTLNTDGELADVVLEIAGKKSPAALLYCLDSHDYSTVEGIDGYGWFTQEQVGWYRARSAAYTAANGGKPLPAAISSSFHTRSRPQLTRCGSWYSAKEKW